MGGGLQKFQMDSMEWWMESMEWGMDSMWNPPGIHGIHVEFHVESMESMLAETTANSWFHGHHGFHMECRYIHHGFHGQVHMDSMEWSI